MACHVRIFGMCRGGHGKPCPYKCGLFQFEALPSPALRKSSRKLPIPLGEIPIFLEEIGISLGGIGISSGDLCISPEEIPISSGETAKPPVGSGGQLIQARVRGFPAP